MTSDRIAKEKSVSWFPYPWPLLIASSLRRRFQQNQEDCTITVLELLPTVTENVLEALPSERYAQELQQKKKERLGRNIGTSDGVPSELSSATSAKDDDGRSLSSFQSESYFHTSQVATSSSGDAEARPPRTKVQLWNNLKISGECPLACKPKM